MEPESEPLSAIQFVQEAEPDKNPDWDRESDWSEDSSIAWSEDEDERLCNEILREPDDLWPLVNERVFEELHPLEWSLVQHQFNQNQEWYIEEGVFFNLDHESHSIHADRALRQLEEVFRVRQEALWNQLHLQLNQ